jgi:hypothetical protein
MQSLLHGLQTPGCWKAGPEAERELGARIPVGRLGKPGEVGEAIMLLVGNSYLTNQTLLVDGGMYPHERRCPTPAMRGGCGCTTRRNGAPFQVDCANDQHRRDSRPSYQRVIDASQAATPCCWKVVSKRVARMSLTRHPCWNVSSISVCDTRLGPGLLLDSRSLKQSK